MLFPLLYRSPSELHINDPNPGPGKPKLFARTSCGTFAGKLPAPGINGWQAGIMNEPDQIWLDEADDHEKLRPGSVEPFPQRPNNQFVHNIEILRSQAPIPCPSPQPKKVQFDFIKVSIGGYIPSTRFPSIPFIFIHIFLFSVLSRPSRVVACLVVSQILTLKNKFRNLERKWEPILNSSRP